ncbi:MAG TPA: 50S ribosomal protein L30 [Deltaproteobacteria bacterium]|nr:50S ribosomal protein L30 [Deltaproteobacteria bacterium]HIF62735.1 50S ribosomal protein L30 [Candidatus Binatota bacterium]HIL13571.1 50S ribosomal protein L30 [Deltaproteobacteria bacterium]
MSSSEKMIRVRMTGSFIGCTKRQRATLRGLGLSRRGRCAALRETPEVRGMINKVLHLVKVEE